MSGGHKDSITYIVATAAVVLLAWLARGWLVEGRADLAGASIAAATPIERHQESESQQGLEKKPLHDDARIVSDDERMGAIARGQLWQQPPVPIGKAHLGASSKAPDELSCKFKLSQLGGTTPKFDCVLESGEEIRIKYGKGPEIPAEAAATRLLKALGFGADEVTLVRHLRCYGCPAEPFSTMRAVEVTRAEPLYKHVIDYNTYKDFEWVALERKFGARPIETDKLEGWAFFELDKVDSAKGGAPRPHVDALRLLALFLAHWDNKSENQRLVCLRKDWPEGAPCAAPFLLIQDAGATFGPSKVDLEAWEKAQIWEDRASCRTSMRHLPYDGATYGEARITEAGRRFLGNLMKQLSEPQLMELFSGARFDRKRGLFSASRPVADWVRVFKARVRAITDGPACPAA